MTANAVPFLSSDGISTSDLTLARKLYDTNATLSFRQNAKYANSPLPWLDRRSVSGASSFRFYMFGEGNAPEKEYVSGNDIAGQDYAMSYGDVTVDDIITAKRIIGEKDAIVSHISMAPLVGTENGRQVALELERRLFNQWALAARASAVTKMGLTIHNGGQRVTRVGGSATVATALATAYPKSATGAANLRSDLRDLGYLADVANWPEDSRYIVMDAYLRQVLQSDASGTLFSSDYQEDNKILNRKIMVIDGWKVMGFEKRATTQGGLIPDSNVTSYTRSTQFNANFVPQATTAGYPAVLAVCAAGEDQAPVGMGSWKGMTSVVRDPVNTGNHTTEYETYCLTGIAKEKVYNAASIEVLLS